MKRSIEELAMRRARMRRMGGYPPPNETSRDRQSKISHLLRIMLQHSSLNPRDYKFVDNMGQILNRRSGLEPSTALTEKQARLLRQIIYRNLPQYKHALPALPSGVSFEDEVRRLLKSQENPNQARNDLIKQGEAQVLAQIKADYIDIDQIIESRPNVTYKGTKNGEMKFYIEFEHTVWYNMASISERGEGPGETTTVRTEYVVNLSSGRAREI